MLVSLDQRRGCGWRDETGALYLVSDGLYTVCGKMPIPLAEVCECCGQLKYTVRVDGKLIKQSRALRNLMDPAPLINGSPCGSVEDAVHDGCPLKEWPSETPALLEWIGRQYYETPIQFEREAYRLGISRRVRGLPEWFEIGKHWVFLAHLDAIPLPENQAYNQMHPDEEPLPEYLPGIFNAFRPTRVEVLVDERTTQEELKEYQSKGYTPTRVVRVNDDGEILCTKCNRNVAEYSLDPEDWDQYNLPLCRACWVGVA